MNSYAFRNAALSLLALGLVAAVATVVPAANLHPGREPGWGWSVGASGLGGIHLAAGVRGSPPGAVLVAFSPARPGRDATAPTIRRDGAAPVSLIPVHGAAVSAPGRPFQPPVEPPLRVTRRFDGPPRPWLPGHRGVDLASAFGATVWAAGAGEVVFAGPVAGRSVVSIQHAGGLRTTYEPLTPVVRRGDHIAAGDPIGTLDAGHAGCPAAACLHWGLRRDAEYLDPLLLLGFRVRLLPI
ncbi:M23 family metallopeptidase [Asanoa sp. NPDC049573]|uniref:murein hydrolase activator EnvC family protein n=1 Tax=Asanoa sp. NPDC049573 TaxID=3155396 RepID=UPI00342B65B4